MMSRHFSDTIAAISTAPGQAGIGIVRISGPQAVQVADKLYTDKHGNHVLPAFQAGSIHFGNLVDSEGKVADEVMVSVFRAPHSYTTEDTVEINTHGGIHTVQKALSLALDAGARLAQPGEFTKRAFLGGRIDLAQAEAVMDIIAADSEGARKIAVSQLSGELSDRVRAIRESLIYEIAFIESALDDPENFSLDGYPEKLDEKLAQTEHRLEYMISHAQEGSLIREGVATAIVGKPNAGKSSLLNRLSGRERSIVTQIPGTTRDTVDESIRLGDITLRLIDTAGIRTSDDPVEKIGIERSRAAAEEAALLLFVTDNAAGISAEDRETAAMLSPMIRAGKPCIVILNKSDLSQGDEQAVKELLPEGIEILPCSMETGEGIEALRRLIPEVLGISGAFEDGEPYVTNLRHREALEEALSSVRYARESIAAGMSEDFLAPDMMHAYEQLGLILGEQVEDDLVEEIFSRFCLGK